MLPITSRPGLARFPSQVRDVITQAVRGPAWPVPGYQASPSSIVQGHRALDIPAKAGTPVVAARSGIVRIGGGDPGYGTLVRVEDPATGLESLYAHLSGIVEGLLPGQRVQAGDVIGYVGSTGNSSGPHLHFEVNPIGRERFNRTRSDLAAVDPWGYLEGYSMSAPVGIADNRNVLQVATTVPPPKALTKGSTTSKDRASAAVSGPPGSSKVSSAPLSVTQGQGIAASAPTKTDDSRLFPGGPKVSTVTGWAQRIGLWGIGGAVFLVGVLILAWSFRDEIEAGVGKATDTVAKVSKVGVGAAAGGPAGAVGGAIV